MGTVTRIFDNISHELGAHLRRTLPGYDQMDVAVGYFNLRGWQIVDDLVASKAASPKRTPSVRILIGMATGTEQSTTIERSEERRVGKECPV